MGKRKKAKAPASDELPMGPGLVEPFREILGFTAEQWARATHLVMIHMLIDEVLTLLLWRRMGALSDLKGTARLYFEHRVSRAETAGWIPKSLATDLRRVNRLRVKLLHYDPAQRRPVKPPPEILTRDACIRAWNLAVDSLRDLHRHALP